MKKRIIDKRKKEKFMLDDEYLNGQARLCSWQGTIVYNSLCRHANKSQESFPSIKLMSEQHSVSRGTIIKGLKRLEENNLINIKKTRNKNGSWLNNTYILIDKSEWIYNQVDENDTVQVDENDTVQVHLSVNPSPPQRKPKSTSSTLRKHIEGNTLKEEASVNFLLNLPPKDVEDLKSKLHLSDSQVKKKAEELYDYCEAKGKRYKNYKAFLRNALRKDYANNSEYNI